MRITLATTLSLSLIGCVGSISGGPEEDIPESCGNGTMDEGESCDDGNNADGDGCSAVCVPEAVPRASLTVDFPAVTTDLEVGNEIVVTATSELGFTGTVSLSAAVADAGNAAIADWATTFDNATLDLTSATTATAKLTITAPGNTAALAGTVKISGTSSGPIAQANIGVTANPVVHVTFNEVGGLCSYDQNHVINNPYRIKAGRQIMVYNNTTQLMTVHVSAITGFTHQGGTMSNGQAYAGTPTVPGEETDFYCHNGGNTIVDAVPNAQRPHVRVE